VFAHQVLDHFGLSGYFAHVSGSEPTGRARYKDEVVNRALTALGLVGRSDVCMVGDRATDVTGAAAAGVDGVAVGWGYAAEGELQSAGAIAVVQTPAELLAFLSQESGASQEERR
jgi:phosphoglycolate phosphatase